MAVVMKETGEPTLEAVVRARDQIGEAKREFAELLAEAIDGGVGVTTMARELGLSRSRLYQIADEARARQPSTNGQNGQ